MPRTPQHTREEMVRISLQIVRRQGAEALTARNIGKAMGCSSSPIFTLFDNMDDLISNVRKAGKAMFSDYVKDVTEYHPAFKEYGLRLIRFAVREKNLFDFLFLDFDAFEKEEDPVVMACLSKVSEEHGLSSEQTSLLFAHMWPFACGLAVLSSRNPERYSEERVNSLLSFQFSSLMHIIRSGVPVVNPLPSRQQ